MISGAWDGCAYVHAEGNVTVTPVGFKLLRLELEGYERDVRVVHCLQGDSLVRAVEVAIGHEFLDG